MKDLEGLLVVALEQAVAAPYASCKLADAGARVIKVERPEGDFARQYDSLVRGESAYFVWINRGKESVCLDLKHREDLALMKAMLEKADIFIHNLSPGAVDRMSLDDDTLRTLNPALINCSISGYGSSGPASDQKAYDLLVQAESGLCAITGGDAEPARVGVSVCDIAAGMTACQAILQALIGRSKTGRGRLIEVSLFHALSDWMNVPYLQHRYGNRHPARVGLRHPTIAPYGAFTCGDGKIILIAIQNEREWARLCTDVLADPDLATRPGFAGNSDRVENRAIVDGFVANALGGRDREANAELLKNAGIAFGRLNEGDDMLTHPQHRLIRVQTDGGPVEMLAPGAVISGEHQSFGAVPSKNAHGDAVRQEFGKRDS